MSGSITFSTKDFLEATKDMNVRAISYDTPEPSDKEGVRREEFYEALGKISRPDEPQPDEASE